jgi:LacI family fructose operon transcriptional repressor
MAGIKEVAEIAGVSTATVSRVLANKPYVRPEVRERVLAAVSQLAYRPNRVARSLRSQQSNSIGLIVSDIRNPFFNELSRAVEDTAYAHGYSVVLCNTDENPQKEELYLNLMHDEHVAGIVLSPTRQSITRFADLNIEIPTVLVDRSLKNGDADAVLLDNVAAANELTTHLIEQGYQRIGAIFASVSTTGRERQRGYEDAHREHNLAPRADLVRHVPPKIETGYAAALDLFSASQPPDAILTGNSLLTAGVLQAIRERGYKIPDQVALVGFDDTIWATLVEPAITVLAQPTDDIGRSATELLLGRIADPSRPTRKVILQGQMRVRGSSVRR